VLRGCGRWLALWCIVIIIIIVDSCAAEGEVALRPLVVFHESLYGFPRYSCGPHTLGALGMNSAANSLQDGFTSTGKAILHTMFSQLINPGPFSESTALTTVYHTAKVAETM